MKLYPQEHVRAVRKDLGLSVVAFAEAMGVSAQTVYKWEEGKKKPQGSAMKLMDRLEVDNAKR